MAERTHRERNSRPREVLSDHQEARGVVILTLFNVSHPEIDEEDPGLAEPFTGALPVCTITDREKERG